MAEQKTVSDFVYHVDSDSGSGDFSSEAIARTDECVCKIAAVRYKRLPSWANKNPIYSQPRPGFEVILLPYESREGEPLRDTAGEVLAPLSRWVYKDLNPTALKFQQDGKTPSVARSFLWNSIGIEITDPNLPIGMENLIVVDEKCLEVKDEKQKKKYFAEIIAPKEDGSEAHKKLFLEKPLTAKGYMHYPDFRAFVGHYMTTGIDVKQKKDGTATNVQFDSFKKAPKAFVPDAAIEKEIMGKFFESYEKSVAKSIVRESNQFDNAHEDSSENKFSEDIALEELEF